MEGKQRVGQDAHPDDWRIARTIFVVDDDATAERYGRREAASPYRYYWSMLRRKMMISKRHGVFETHQAQNDDAITDDYLVDRLVICGSVNKGVDDILRLREQVGDFGELVYANMDWVDPALAKRSMNSWGPKSCPE